jgi:hypothetical protein
MQYRTTDYRPDKQRVGVVARELERVDLSWMRLEGQVGRRSRRRPSVLVVSYHTCSTTLLHTTAYVLVALDPLPVLWLLLHTHTSI